MSDDREVSRARTLAASAGMLASAGALASLLSGVEPGWLRVGFVTAVAASGVGLTRGSMVVRILSRGVAWLMVTQFLVYLALTGQAPPLTMLTMALASAVALVLARPALDTPGALAQFAPKAFRRLFLAGGIVTAASSLGLLSDGVVELASPGGSTLLGLGFSAIAASMLASVAGVMRMRAWGVLLGTLTSLGLSVAAVVGTRHAVLPFGILALPMALGFLGPIVLARLGIGAGTNARVVDDAPVRVVTDEATLEGLEGEEELLDDEASPPLRKRARQPG